jgi:hypothetical protein
VAAFVAIAKMMCIPTSRTGTDAPRQTGYFKY